MKPVTFASSFVLAGILAAGGASAEIPYGPWGYSTGDVSIVDSFKSEEHTQTSTDIDTRDDHSQHLDTRISSDDDVTTDDDYSYSSDDDVTTDDDYSYSSDDDITTDDDYSYSSDDDSAYSSDDDSHWTQEITETYSSVYESSDDDVTNIDNSQDNDQDNDWTNTESTDIVLDFQLATPTMTSHKYQDQEAGHEADATVLGAASGHDVGVAGGTNVVSAGNDETVYYGPALINENTNQLPQNNLFIQGSNGAPISQDNTFAGRDMGPKGVFAPIGNTSAMVSGDVENTSASGIEQSGDSSNDISESMSSFIGR